MTDDRVREIAPCPFCASTNLTMTVDAQNWNVVQCDNCGASGPCIDLEGDAYINRWNERAIASLPAPVGVPEGWKLVPVEPTPEILSSLFVLPDMGPNGQIIRHSVDKLPDAYRAMLSVSPPPPQSGEIETEIVSGVRVHHVSEAVRLKLEIDTLEDCIRKQSSEIEALRARVKELEAERNELFAANGDVAKAMHELQYRAESAERKLSELTGGHG